MGSIELFIIAVGLSMDAFAVSVCKGLAMKKCTWAKAVIVGLWFGIFQAGMPLIGYFLGSQFKNVITSFDHWIAFLLLAIIGLHMIKEARTEACEISEAELDIKTMFGLAIATSIDALAVGVTFAFLKVQIIPAVSFIGIVTFVLSLIGVRMGNVFGTRYKSKAEWVGGLILILMGFKILVEHLGIFG
ncbi:MAG: manganese efflux pump MntP family protein [Lachnospiraceae bacterium]|nr:manganese efflux pump MntP family protein [Lachnospiraceae bacterium]